MMNLPPIVLRGLSMYIDPGTGSLIIQILIASFVGGLFLLKSYWKKVRGWFRKVRRKE